MCKTCKNQSVKYNPGDPCPELSEAVEEWVKEMTVTLGKAKDDVLKERHLLEEMYDIPDTFTNHTSLVLIEELGDVEQKYSRYLSVKNKPLRILQLMYIRTLLLSAYMDALGKILSLNHPKLSHGLVHIGTLLRRVTCAINGQVINLGLKKIKRGVTKRLCKFRSEIDVIGSRNYETAILQYGNQLLQDSITDLSELRKETSMYRFNCRPGKMLKMKLKRPTARNLRRGRKHRKGKGKKNLDRNNKSKRRCRNRTKNTKGDPNDRKQRRKSRKCKQRKQDTGNKQNRQNKHNSQNKRPRSQNNDTLVQHRIY